jgi:hypothetical protein
MLTPRHLVGISTMASPSENRYRPPFQSHKTHQRPFKTNDEFTRGK